VCRTSIAYGASAIKGILAVEERFTLSLFCSAATRDLHSFARFLMCEAVHFSAKCINSETVCPLESETLNP
jgi:hypothetical protein